MISRKNIDMIHSTDMQFEDSLKNLSNFKIKNKNLNKICIVLPRFPIIFVFFTILAIEENKKIAISKFYFYVTMCRILAVESRKLKD